MSRIENFIGRHSKIAKAADQLMPEKAKGVLRKYMLGEKYPLEEPVIKKIGKVEGKFWIRNPSDWYRIAKEGFEEEFINELINTIHPGEVFLDIGSAQGLYSILAAKAGAYVYSADPDPVSVESIARNISLNLDIEDRVNILDFAFGAEDGVMALNIDPTGTYAPSLKQTTRGLKEKVDVKITSLDNLLALNKIIPPNIIKIDVEGAEGLVLAGMSDFLTSSERPQHLFMELHPQFLPQFEMDMRTTLNQINDMGYTPFGTSMNHRNKDLYHFMPAN